MRTLVAIFALLAGACVSDSAARRVQIVGAKPEGCRVVAERLRGAGRDNNAAFMSLRREAVRKGADQVVVTDGPRSGSDQSVVDAIGYACATPAR